MSSAEMDEQLKYVKKLRKPGVSFENCEKITNLKRNCCRPGYRQWCDRNNEEVKALVEKFNKRIKYDYGLPSDEDDRAREERKK